VTTQEIQRLRSAPPFELFRLMVADGTHYDVRHPEDFTLTGNGQLMAIAMPHHFVTLDLLLVTAVQRPIPRKKNGPQKRAA
jgi:hypothetical protein